MHHHDEQREDSGPSHPRGHGGGRPASEVVSMTGTRQGPLARSPARLPGEGDRYDPTYLATMADIVECHGGTLNEFAGDAAMALFGVPLERAPEDEVIAAVAAATEIQATLPVLVQRWFKLGLDHELRAQVGINTGVLSVGTFGSDGRATYTGIGLQTNIAARIQANCDPGLGAHLVLTSSALRLGSQAPMPRLA